MSDPVSPPEAPPEPDPLADAEGAIARGDLVEARRLARDRLGSDDPDARKRAREIVERLSLDLVTLGVMIATGAVIVMLALLYLKAH